MYLLFDCQPKALHYSLFSNDGEEIYQDLCPLADWTPKSVQKIFAMELVPKLRTQGKLWSKIGLIIPFAEAEYHQPRPAEAKLLRKFMTTQLRQRVLEPSFLVLQASQKAWPHLPHWFLFDTCLSHQITRELVLPPFQYEVSKAFHLHPTVLHSYGHKANLAQQKSDSYIVSLYVDR